MAGVCSRGAPAINQVTNGSVPGKLRNADRKGRNCEILWENEFPFRGRTITRKWKQDFIWRLSEAEYGKSPILSQGRNFVLSSLLFDLVSEFFENS